MATVIGGPERRGETVEDTLESYHCLMGPPNRRDEDETAGAAPAQGASTSDEKASTAPGGRLGGLRVLLTRPRAGAEAWTAPLTAAGAVVVSYPTIAIRPFADLAPLDERLDELGAFTGLVFTSSTAVEVVAARLVTRGLTPPSGPWVAAVGSSTATTLARHGFGPLLVPQDQRQEGLIALLPSDLQGARVFFPQAAGGRELLAEVLRARGAIVDVLPVYETSPIRPLPPLPAFDVAAFASPSSLASFLAWHGPAALRSRRFVVLGPTTAATAVRHGLRPAAEAPRPSAEGLLVALATLAPQVIADAT